jgi:hypothetical protein
MIWLRDKDFLYIFPAYGKENTNMPLPGGATDKFGNRYEGRWTVMCMIDVLDEEADAIRLEPPGVEGEGIEFWVRRGEARAYHQVKRQHSASGR